jgi:hypothetical protein
MLAEYIRSVFQNAFELIVGKPKQHVILFNIYS